MGKKELILREIEEIPETSLQEILDFIHSLKTKGMGEKLDISIASEASLGKDWLREEEDEAWRDL